MNDQEWLKRVTIAYEVYKQQVGETLPVEEFIIWLYKQYGIIPPKGKQ